MIFEDEYYYIGSSSDTKQTPNKGLGTVDIFEENENSVDNEYYEEIL